MVYPLAQLVDGLIELIERVEGTEDPRWLDVLAAVYVAAVDLRARGALECGVVGKRCPEPIHGLSGVLHEVCALDRHDPSLAYASLLRALLGMERALTDLAIEPDAAGAVELDGVWPGLDGLAGRVRWWVRPRSLWSAVLEGDERRTRRRVYGLPPHRLLRRIGLDWDPSATFAEPVVCDVAAGDPFGPTVRRVGDRSPYLDTSLRVVLHPLDPELWPWFHVVAGAGGLVVDVHPDRYNDAAGVERGLRDAIVGSRAGTSPQLLVFPELMVDEAARVGLPAAVRDGGPLFGVFAGSTHLTLADGRRVSQALVLDPDGVPWWAHHKRGSFRCDGRAILAARGAARMFVPQDTLVQADEAYHEAFVEGTCLRFCDTSLGRLVVLVCSDLLDWKAWGRTVDRLEPDFLIVVSMSDRAARFLEKAKTLADEGRVSTLYVNAACDTRIAAPDAAPDVDVLAFVQLAVDDTVDRPARVCWRRGRGLERWDHKKATWVGYEGPFLGFEGGGMWIDLGAFLLNR